MGGIYSTESDRNDDVKVPPTNNSFNVSNNNSAAPQEQQQQQASAGDPGANTNTNAFAFALAPSDASALKRSSSQVFLDETVANNSVVIFSKTTCSFCDKAKEVFDALGVGYRTVELDRRGDCAQLQDYLNQMTGARTVPRVFVDGDCIGGGSDTVSMFKKGSLQKLLKRKNIDCPNCEPETSETGRGE